ncbi:hypothetical protein ACAW74_18550 [Fibrella sp. WM1]|uniref:hypothetical protein n=1 Tax=Fibrella musci TaxID=3242485 RepID=UPI003521EEA0
MQKTVYHLFTVARRVAVLDAAASRRLIRVLFRRCPLFYLTGLLIWLVYWR